MAERAASAIGLLSTLLPTFVGSGKTTTTNKVNTQTLDDGSIASLKNLVSGGQYSKEAAVNDAEGALQNAIRLLLQQGTPEITTAQKKSGIYNDTTTQLLSNDLTSRVAGEAANLQQQNVKNYADIQATAAQTLKGATNVGTETSTQKTGPAIDPLVTLGVLAGGTILSNLFGSKKKSGSSSGFDAPPNTSTSGFSGGSIESLFNAITPSFSSQGSGGGFGSSPSGGSGAGSSSGDFFSGIFGNTGSLLGDIGTSLLGGLLGGSSGNTSGFGSTTGPSAGSAGDIGNQGSSTSGGGNSIGEFFTNLLGGLFGF